MTDAEALDLAIERTGVARYRILVERDPRYWPIVYRAAGVEPYPPGDDAAKARMLEAVRTCPHRGPVLPTSQQPECGCAELTLCLSLQRGVSLDDCLFCRLKAMPR